MTDLPASVVLDEVDSTNAEAQRRAPVEHPLWIAARRQTAARGREGRAWASPEGNLAATLLMPRDEPPAQLARYSFHAALAVHDLFACFASRVPVTVKWPNDVLLDGRKAAGILLENFGGSPAQLAIGIGANLAHAPAEAETRWPATSLAAETDTPPDFDLALGVVMERLAHWIALDAAQGFGQVRAAWIVRAARLGQPIEARLPRETLTGIFEDVDSHGLLVLRTADGRRRISAADIFFPE